MAQLPHRRGRRRRGHVTVAGQRFPVATDRSGIVDVRLPNPGLAPGWHTVGLATAGAEPATADVLVVGADVDLGLVSDIDDTVITTWLPRPLLATYNTFVLAEDARTPVAGMAELYAGLLADHPGAPTVYVSTGPWNAARALSRFLAHHGFPRGPLLLTDWGPTNTGWFRSGREHKRACLRGLAEDFPAIRWVLVGDDGQRDPVIYAEFAREHPDRVRAIALRELPMGQQVADGTPTELPDGTAPHRRPEVRGADGHVLATRRRGPVCPAARLTRVGSTATGSAMRQGRLDAVVHRRHPRGEHGTASMRTRARVDVTDFAFVRNGYGLYDTPERDASPGRPSATTARGSAC